MTHVPGPDIDGAGAPDKMKLRTPMSLRSLCKVSWSLGSPHCHRARSPYKAEPSAANGPRLTAAARDGAHRLQAGQRNGAQTEPRNGWLGELGSDVVECVSNDQRSTRSRLGLVVSEPSLVAGRATVTRMCRDPRLPARRGSVARPACRAIGRDPGHLRPGAAPQPGELDPAIVRH